MVSLHDIDADVILLDFWGSWCAALSEVDPAFDRAPVEACRKTSSGDRDRMRESGERLRPPGQRRQGCSGARVSTTRCCSRAETDRVPLQEALQIQFYPTMVLLSRDGRLLAREHGATDITLPRMDRAITMALQSHESSKTK